MQGGGEAQFGLATWELMQGSSKTKLIPSSGFDQRSLGHRSHSTLAWQYVALEVKRCRRADIAAHHDITVLVLPACRSCGEETMRLVDNEVAEAGG